MPKIVRLLVGITPYWGTRMPEIEKLPVDETLPPP